VVRNDPLPDRLSSIVEDLLLLDENELIGIRANVEALAEAKKGKATGTNSLQGHIVVKEIINSEESKKAKKEIDKLYKKWSA
jgi:hypothetical protein